LPFASIIVLKSSPAPPADSRPPIYPIAFNDREATCIPASQENLLNFVFSFISIGLRRFLHICKESAGRLTSREEERAEHGWANRVDQDGEPVLINSSTSKAATALHAWNGSCRIDSNPETQIIDTNEVDHDTPEDSGR
jgi:hypothetical protein